MGARVASRQVGKYLADKCCRPRKPQEEQSRPTGGTWGQLTAQAARQVPSNEAGLTN